MKKAITLIFLLALAGMSLSSRVQLMLNGIIDLNQLENYANQEVPDYITKDNTPPNNPITDEGATLGRVLFYDKNLSVNNTISCASCHLQEFAFSDPAQLSIGRTGGVTGRHAMRLVNARFADERRFFWDERANSVEAQSTLPIQDHVEMGFSGMDGDPGLDSLFSKMEALDYYQELFTFVYGDTTINENRMQRALAQFIRSIQGFDSKYDEGRAQVGNNNMPFPNFTNQENMGKRLFMSPPGGQNGGAGCNGCHRAPEFDIAPNSRNNGIIGVAGDPDAIDLTNTRSPSLRDLFNPDGLLNGPMMHTGEFDNLLDVINHYNNITLAPQNTNLDNRLTGGPGGQGQNLNLTENEKGALIAFLQTLTSQAVYTDPRWADPFDEEGNLTIINACIISTSTLDISICAGEEFEGYSESGSYEDIFMSVAGCDSIRILDLTILEALEETIDVSICAGEAYEGYSETGSYQDFYVGANNCDSTRILNLTVLPSDDPACISTATEEAFAENLSIYPNPFQSNFQINCLCKGEYVYRLYDYAGKKVLEGQLDFAGNEANIQTDHLTNGMYVIQLVNLDGGLKHSQYILKNN